MAENIAPEDGQSLQNITSPQAVEGQLDASDLKKGAHGTEYISSEIVQESEKGIEGEQGEGRTTAVERPAETKGVEGEGDKTKEGQLTEVGEKRERPIDEGLGVGGEQEEAEKEVGKQTKKPKPDMGEQVQEEGEKAPPAKKGRGRKAGQKTAAKRTQEKGSAAGEVKKRPVGRPRKNTTVAKPQEGEPKQVQQEPAVSTTKDSTLLISPGT